MPYVTITATVYTENPSLAAGAIEKDPFAIEDAINEIFEDNQLDVGSIMVSATPN